MPRFIAALDQGTTSTRLLLFDAEGRVAALERREHRQITPRAGWVEHDPLEIVRCCEEVLGAALEAAGADAEDVAALGIANQRETTVLWDRETGEPVHNAIVWQDTRTAGIVRELAGAVGPDRLRADVGLPLSTYFSGPKLAWLLDQVTGARARAQAGELAFGTIDTWLLWNLTGGPRGGVHATDTTNASRTMLMDLRTLDWHEPALGLMGVPAALLPRIGHSSATHGVIAHGPLAGVRVCGLVGDQQAALLGQGCLERGSAKSTYGTGSFLLVNTGETIVPSPRLLTSVAATVAGRPTSYVLEGAIAVTGAAVQWLRDRLGVIGAAAEVEALAASVPDNGGVYFVPAFSGLFAPHWREDARGVIVGLTAYAGAAHIARATLEATAWQTREVLDAMAEEGRLELAELRVDGGMTANGLLMQLQADVLGIPVVRPAIIETTALGAAFAAGLACGFWSGEEELRELCRTEARWEPGRDQAWREQELARWGRAVERSLGWAELTG